MKKICIFVVTLALLLGACALAEGSALHSYDKKTGYQYVHLGAFPQDADGTVRPILWRVLTVGDGEALLLSEYILFNNRVHPDDKEYIAFGGAFNQTEMFKLLNGPFEGDPIPQEEQDELKRHERLGRVHIAEIPFKDQAFTQGEQQMLVTDEALGTVFLLSADDLKNKFMGFASSKDRKAWGTEYALENGLFQYQNGSSPYWTRSPSQSYDYATRCTKVDGDLGYIRCVVMNEGCRPAVRLKLDGLEIAGGEGTKDNPYTFVK